MTQILDYSAGYPGAAAITDRGFPGVIRYLRKEGTSSVKPLTAAEYTDMLAHGRTVADIYQHVSKTRVLEGRSAGRHDAAWALARARDTRHEPRAIYFAVDFDTIGPQQWAAVREYMVGAAEILGVGRVGCYGEYDLLDYLFARETITWGWQTYAWSTGHNQDTQTRHPRAHLFQRRATISVNGVDCDVNDVLKTDHGQTPAPQEDDMTPEQARQLHNLDRVLTALLLDSDQVTQLIDQDGNTVEYPLTFTARLRALEARPTVELTGEQLNQLAVALVNELEQRGLGAGITEQQIRQVLGAVTLAGQLQVRDQPL